MSMGCFDVCKGYVPLCQGLHTTLSCAGCSLGLLVKWKCVYVVLLQQPLFHAWRVWRYCLILLCSANWNSLRTPLVTLCCYDDIHMMVCMEMCCILIETWYFPQWLYQQMKGALLVAICCSSLHAISLHLGYEPDAMGCHVCVVCEAVSIGSQLEEIGWYAPQSTESLGV